MYNLLNHNVGHLPLVGQEKTKDQNFDTLRENSSGRKKSCNETENKVLYLITKSDPVQRS